MRVVPEEPPIGAVVERDGPLVRTHYGTHGTVDHRTLPESGLDDLIVRSARRSRPPNGNTSPWTRLLQRRAHPDFLVDGRHMFWDTCQLFQSELPLV